MAKRVAKRSVSSKPLPPELKRPIVVRRPSESDADGFSPNELQDQINQLRMAKLPLVCDYLDIPPDADDTLMRLIFALLPVVFGGFDAVYDDYQGPGRKPKWLNGEDLKLFHAAQNLIRPNCDLDAALGKIKREWGLTQGVSTLRKHYYNGAGKYARAMVAAQQMPQFARFFGIEPLPL